MEKHRVEFQLHPHGPNEESDGEVGREFVDGPWPLQRVVKEVHAHEHGHCFSGLL